MSPRGCCCRTTSVEELTEQDLKDIFRQYDRDGDGILSKEELQEAFKYLGSMFPSWRASRSIHFSDIDGDGYINEPELEHLVKYVAPRGYYRLKP